MASDKVLLEKSVDALVDKANECVDLAKEQRKSADKQHDNARKLEVLGHALARDAAEIQSETDQQGDDEVPGEHPAKSPRLPTRPASSAGSTNP
jgi:peptidoglycan hydrolase CwlO-like protein